MATLCLIFKAKAQEVVTLSGRVTDQQNRSLSGVTIKIKNTTTETLTNYSGYFSIICFIKQGTIQASFLGYKIYEASFNGTTNNLSIKLQESTNDLNEVQVIGYGQTTRRLNTGSVSSISAKQIEQQPVTNVLSALSGRMPGVFVQTTNGLPGGNINIQIRGKGSIAAGTNPLYIVDGVPYDGAAPNPTNSDLSGSIAGTISPLNNLNPSDIESITVLKDADATSIYGSRGSNGVVLITTKMASTGDTRIVFNIQQGVSKVAQKPKLLNLKDYLEIREEAFTNEGITPSADPTSPYYAPDLKVWSQTQGTDWVDYLFGNSARSSDLQGRVSGGKGQTTFSVSGNYHYENLIIPGSNDFRRSGLSSQFQHQSENNKLRIAISNSFTHQYNALSNAINAIDGTMLLAPNYPLRLPDGSLNWYAGINILGEINARSKTKTDNSITSLNIGYNILPLLNFKINAGYTKTTYDQILTFPNSAIPSYVINNTTFGKNSSQSFLLEPQLDYSVKLKSVSISFLAGATLQNRQNDMQMIKASNFKRESLMEDLGSAGTIDVRTNDYMQYKYASLFGRAAFNLNDTYILNTTIRRDGSSRFGPGQRFGNFGSVGAAWIFSNLSFIKERLSFLSYGKIRGSYGTSGNDQIGDYQYLSTYSSPGSNIYQNVAAVSPNRIANAHFHWETTHKTDIALELGFLKDRLILSADYYLNRSKDQLILYSIPQITGFADYQANLPAVIENKGLELSINANILATADFSWSTSFNLTLPRNKLKSFQDFQNSSYAKIFELGYDITRIYGYKSLGIDQATGKLQYADKNGEVSSIAYPYNTLGKLTPDYYGGFNNTFKYKNFELSVFAQFVKQVAQGGLRLIPGSFGLNSYNLVKNRWTESNRNTHIPKASANGFDINYGSSSENVFNTSYFRLKNVSLSYNLPETFLARLKINQLRVFAEGQNLFTLWNKNAAILDPEFGVMKSGSSLSINSPTLTTVVLGIQLTL